MSSLNECSCIVLSLAGVDPELGASNRLPVIFLVLAHVVVRAVIGDVENFVRQRIGLSISRALAYCSRNASFAALPATHGRHLADIGHLRQSAKQIDRRLLPLDQPLANLVCDLLRE
jgi:hypothetical protein